jgi:hypothetical protein
MTPKEKAEQLVRKYYTFGLNNPAQSFSWYECQECALIAVDEILKEKCALIAVDEILNETRILYDISWWFLVKSEIEKL